MSLSSSNSESRPRQSAVVVDIAGRTLIQHYGDPMAEALAVRKTGGFIDLSHWGIVRFTGKDTLRFVHGMVSNDVKGLPDGGGNHTCVLTNKGKIIADYFNFRLGESLVGFCQQGLADVIVKTLDRYIIADKVTPENLSDTHGLIGFHGPRVHEILASLVEGPLPSGQNFSLTSAPFEGEECAEPACILHAPTAPGASWFVLLPKQNLIPAWKKITEAGEALGMGPYGLEAMDIVRIEEGRPIFGKDFDTANFPNEAKLDHTVSYRKGCYIGQETMARISAMGHVNKHLVGLLPDGRVQVGDEIHAGDAKSGAITSATFSPILDKWIALGYVKRDHAKPGTQVEVGLEGNRRSAEVVETPFVG